MLPPSHQSDRRAGHRAGLDIVVSPILLEIIDLTIGLRVTEEIEMEGLDLSLHGEIVQSGFGGS